MLLAEDTRLFSAGSGSQFFVAFIVSLGLSKLFMMAFNKIFTNVLSTEQIGKYSLILAAVQTLFTYASLGLPSAINRYTYRYYHNKQKNELKNFVFTGLITYQVVNFLIVIGIAIVYFTTGIKLSFINTDPYIYAVLIVGFISMTQVVSISCFTIASSLHNARYYSIPVIMRALLQIPFGILFAIILKLDVLGLIIGLVTTELIVATYSGYIIVRDIGLGKFSLRLWKEMTRYALPTYIIILLVESYNLLILTYVTLVFGDQGFEIVALYRNGALIVVNIVLIAQQMFKIVYRPLIFKYYETSQNEKIESITQTFSKLYSVSYILAGLLLYALSPFIIVILTQSAYIPSIPVIPLILIAFFFDYLRIIVAYGHVLKFKTYWNLISGIVGLVFGITVGIIAIPKVGLLGIGYSLAVFKIIEFLLTFAASQHYFKVKHDTKNILSLLIAAGGGILIGVVGNYFLNLWNIKHALTIAYVAATAVFLILVAGLKIITKHDYEILKNIISTYKQMRFR